MSKAALRIADTASNIADTASSVSNVYGRMGALLGVELHSETDAVRLASAGVPTKAYKSAAKILDFPPALVAPESTVRRRLKANARFSEAESERLIRMARVFAEAVELFGSEEAALQWLNTPQAFIPGEPMLSPLHLAAKDSGARLIESHMRRTAYGIF